MQTDPVALDHEQNVLCCDLITPLDQYNMVLVSVKVKVQGKLVLPHERREQNGGLIILVATDMLIEKGLYIIMHNIEICIQMIADFITKLPIFDMYKGMDISRGQ